MSTALPVSIRSTVKRAPERGQYDPSTIAAIVDASYVCHVAWVSGGQAICIPTACWRMADRLYIHGSNGSRMMKELGQGAPACVTITLLDGLVLAKSAFSHSMNYRSVVIHGQFEVVPDIDKPAALLALTDWVLPGRSQVARPADAHELLATTVLSIGLHEASAKIREGGPKDKVDDADLPVWSGVLPMQLQAMPQQAHHDNEMTPDAAIAHWSRGEHLRR